MAARTYTAVDIRGRAIIGGQAKTVHTGDQSVYVEHSFSATLTVSSIGKLVWVPNGAQIEDFMWAGGPGDGSATIVIGTSASPSCILTATSISAAVATVRGALAAATLPHRVSESDGSVPLGTWIQVKTTANGTSFSAAGGKIRFRLTYRMDEG